MKDYLSKVLFFLFMSVFISGSTYADPVAIQQPMLYTGSSPEVEFSSAEMRVKNAAVKVKTQYGHGSGTYILYNGFNLVITASHVITDESIIFAVNGEESLPAQVVYNNPEADVAVLLIGSMETRTPMRYKPVKENPGVGTMLYYSGYPSSHSLMTIRGLVSGYEQQTRNGTAIIVHGYGWLGCSGSGVYDRHGRFVGVLWAIDMSFYGGPQLVEDMLWISPASNIDFDSVMDGVCEAVPETSRCRRRAN
tara:strand:- start:296 stop:1045 length:750 start_codon:yes stop_codon:yes gene_type:complete